MSTERIDELLAELAELLVEQRRMGLLVHAGTEVADSTVQLFGDGGDEAHDRLARAVVHGLQRLGTAGRRAALGLPQWMQAGVRARIADESERDHLILCGPEVVARGGYALWWGPDERGYYAELEGAGRYTREEAARICRGSPRGAARPVPLAEAIRAAVTVVDLGRLR